MIKRDVIGEYSINYNKSYGDGSQNNCFSCFSSQTNSEYVIKILHPDSQKLKMYQESEYLINSYLKNYDHPNLVKIFDTFLEGYQQNRFYFYIIMEKCQLNLNQYFNSQKAQGRQFSVKNIFTIIKNIIKGYLALIELNIIHRDLKPENILYQDGLFKIADFGCSEIINENQQNLIPYIGTLPYCSPQILKNTPYTNKTDIFSLGLMIWELVFEEQFNLYQFSSLKERIKSKISQLSETNIQLKGSIGEKRELIRFFKYTLKYYERNRISWKELGKWFLHPEQFSPIELRLQSSSSLESPSMQNSQIEQEIEVNKSYPLYVLIEILINLNKLADNISLSLAKKKSLFQNNKQEYQQLQLLILLYKKSVISNGNGIWSINVQNDDESVFQRLERNDIKELIQDYQMNNQFVYKKQKEYLKGTLNEINNLLTSLLSNIEVNQWQRMIQWLDFETIGQKILNIIQTSTVFIQIFRINKQKMILNDEINLLAMILRLADFQLPFASFLKFEQESMLKLSNEPKILFDFVNIYFNE